MVAKLRLLTAAVKHDSAETGRAFTYFTHRWKIAEIQKLLTNDLKQCIDSIKTSKSPTLSWESVKEAYRAAGDSVVSKPAKGRRK